MGIFVILEVVALVVYVGIMVAAYRSYSHGDIRITGIKKVCAVVGTICSIYLLGRHPVICIVGMSIALLVIISVTFVCLKARA